MTWPTLSGTAGDLTTLLDAVLVNGSNTVNVSSITRSGTTATVNTAVGHGIISTDPAGKRRVLIANCDQAEYNGEFTATYVDADTFTIEVSGSPATPATTGSTITARRAPANWTIEYTGTNKRVYRPPSGHQHRLRIADDGTGSAQYARAYWAESFSDVDTGTNLAPTAAQLSGGIYIYKSDAASSATRAWVIQYSETYLHLLIDARNQSTNFHSTWMGDLATSYRPSEGYGTYIVGNSTAALSANVNQPGLHVRDFTASASAGHYLLRPYTQVAGAVNVNKRTNGDITLTVIGGGGGSGYTYPAPMDSGIHIAPIVWNESVGARGVMGGIWAPLHNRPAAHLDTFSGAGVLAGKTFMIVFHDGINASQTGSVVLETSL